MTNSTLATAITLATMSLLGCGNGSSKTVQPDASVRPDASTQSDASVRPDASVPDAFELQGSWLYLGPGDVLHRINISDVSMVYTDVNGQWSSNWTLKEYDNDLHHFQIVFESGTGAYIPNGQSLSGTYVMTGAILTVQLADGLGSYPPITSPGSCIDGASNRIPNCGLYVGQN